MTPIFIAHTGEGYWPAQTPLASQAEFVCSRHWLSCQAHQRPPRKSNHEKDVERTQQHRGRQRAIHQPNPRPSQGFTSYHFQCERMRRASAQALSSAFQVLREYCSHPFVKYVATPHSLHGLAPYANCPRVVVAQN